LAESDSDEARKKWSEGNQLPMKVPTFQNEVVYITLDSPCTGRIIVNTEFAVEKKNETKQPFKMNQDSAECLNTKNNSFNKIQPLMIKTIGTQKVLRKKKNKKCGFDSLKKIICWFLMEQPGYFFRKFEKQVRYLQEITRYRNKLKKLRLAHLMEFWDKETVEFKRELKSKKCIEDKMFCRQFSFVRKALV